jgi:hypothetical protein
MELLSLPWLDLLTKFLFALGGAGMAYAGRRLFNWFDFIPRRLESIGIGTHFGGLRASGPGDQYNHALFVNITNHGGLPLYIVRAIYLSGKVAVPIYVNARRSQKKTKGYELKFGSQWKEMDVLIQPNQSITTYLPLSSSVSDHDFPQGKRGKLYLEYVFAGRTGVHFAPL